MAEEKLQFNNEGVYNLMTAIVDDARKRYINAIAGIAYNKGILVKDEFVNGKWMDDRWEVIRFVKEDPYGIFAPLTGRDVLIGWNRDAQLLVDGWHIRDQLIKKYEEITDYDEALAEVLKDFKDPKIKLDYEGMKKYVAPAIRKNSNIKTSRIFDELRKYGFIPQRKKKSK